MTSATTNFRFSIITVALNNHAGLKQTGQSVQQQDFNNYEWIILDGGSSDGTLEYLEKSNSQWVSETDKGIYDAMNKGVSLATGDYIIFMNAGDQFADNTTLSTIAKHNTDFIYGDSLEEEENERTTHYKKARKIEKINFGMFTHHQSMIYKTSLIKKLRYNLDYTIAADYDFTYRFLKSSNSTAYIEKPLCIFKAGGISQMKAKQGRTEQFKVRQDLDISMLKNASIFIAQTVLYKFRKSCPKIYWFLKRSRQVDNI